VLDLRAGQVTSLREAPLDVLIIGGGINGAGVLRDLSLRAQHTGANLRVGLVEQKHFASGTSGKNSQLIHGGLRYLKYLQFRLVRESLRERSTLRRIAPHFVRPLPFLLPLYGWRSRITYGSGLWLYDFLTGREGIGKHRIVTKEELADIEPALSLEELVSAAVFYDCGIPSARFVVENILDAVDRGAIAVNYLRAENWRRDASNRWLVSCKDELSGEVFDILARKIVDARGAWSGEELRLVRGSHIVLPRLGASEHAIAHFETDGRIVFLIPWGSNNDLTLVGTTDEDHQGSPDDVRISAKERDYLLGVVRKLFPSQTGARPISSFSSLRPLVRGHSTSATSASRGHKIWNSDDGVLHIAGGKYTTYRLMSEEASDLVCGEIAPELRTLHLTEHAPLAATKRDTGEAMEQHLGDYLFVTTYLGYEQRWNEASLRPIAEALGRKRNWGDARVSAEVNAIIEESERVGA